jgi:hypothetical protein
MIFLKDVPGSAPPRTALEEHYRKIYVAHPDADAIVDSLEFKEWIAQYPKTYGRIFKEGISVL